MSGITVGRRDEQLTAVKRDPGDKADRLRREAQLLARLDHSGVVQFIELIDGDPVELHMAYAGADTWARTPPTGADRIIGGLAAVASTVADLHELGTAHRAIVVEHVVTSADHRPVLCGLADAGPANPMTVADDMAGLAGLIDHLSADAPEGLRARLHALVAGVRRGDLTARTLADALNGLRAAPPRAPSGPPAWKVAAGCAAVLVVAAALGAVWLAARSGTKPVTAASPPPTAAPLPSPPPDSAPPPPAPAPTSLAPVVRTNANAPLELVHAGRRYNLGTAGDTAVLGDWNCDGVATPALLRAADGVVAIFATWPEADSAVAADATTQRPAATGLEVVGGATCDQLRIIEPTRSTLFIPELS